MARGWSKFGLLLWKNWVLQKRHVVQTCVEILVPIILSTVVVLIRSLVDPHQYTHNAIYPEFALEIPPSPFPKPNLTLAWSPNVNHELQAIMNETATKMRMKEIGFPSEEALNDYLISPLQPLRMKKTLAGIYFGDENEILSDETELPKELSITFRFPGESRISAAREGLLNISLIDTPSHLYSWWTSLVFPLFQLPGPRQMFRDTGGISPGYFYEGFLSLQQAISTSLIDHLNGAEDVPIPKVVMRRFPYPPFLDDPILQALQAFLALIIMVSFVYTCISTVKVITTEKERQLKEAMKIMGLPNWLHWTAWFLKCFLFLLVSITGIVILLKVRWFPVENGFSTSVFQTSDASVVFFFLAFYIINTITFCFAVSVFFSKANTASTIAGLLWFLTFIPFTLMQPKYSETPLSTKLASCLLGNTAMGYGFQLILMHEGTGVGAQWSNIWSPASPNDDFYLGHVMLMLLGDAAIYMCITIYVEAVFPGDFGVPEPWNFLFKRSYWFGEKYDNSVQDMMTPSHQVSCEVHEPEPTHLPAGVQIRHLNKVYNKKSAVNDLNLNMYQGQITVLLGHNGAGKTTTMSMLTGMITPSSGTAIVSGYDVRTQMNKVRESLGLCPQHNLLFEELTVREHLYFFGKLKGLDGDKLEKEIMKYITMLDLIPKENKQASTLSGGMQRKLAACVALCGNSKVVMFDEPTSGMDPTARRALWDLLQAEKKGRTILLTTHFMDEADLLGDRIAIMAGGDLQCVGSSFYLKKKYGEGYRLVLVKDSNCDVAGTTELLRKFIPSLKVSQNIGTELSYLLQDDLSPIFEQMFEELEDNKYRLKILSYGVSLTTMEEVFMKAGRDQDGSKENGGAELDGNNKSYYEEPLNKYVSPAVVHSSTSELDVESSSSSGRFLSGFALSKNQLYAMFVKKFIYTKRSWLLTAIQVLLPVFFLIITFVITASWQGYKDLPSLEISFKSYDEYYTTIVPMTNESTAMGFYNKYKEIYDEGLIERPLGDNLTIFILEQSENINLVSQHYLVAATFDEDEDNATKVTAWFNNRPLHTPPLSLNLVYNSVLKKKMGNEYGIKIINYPLPFIDSSKLSALMQGDNLGFQVAFNIAFSFAFATAFYVLFTVKERISKAKLLQFVSGVEVLTFWGSAVLWDLATFLLPIVGVVIVMLAFQEKGFSTGDDIGQHVIIMLLFIWASMPLMYLSSFCFTIPSTGYTRVSMVTIMLGCAMFMIVTIIEYPDLELENEAKLLDWIFLLVPHYNLAMSFRTLYNAKVYYDLCTPMLPFCRVNPSPCCQVDSLCAPSTCLVWVDNFFSFQKPGIGRHLTYFAVEGFLFITVLLLLEFKLLDEIYERCRQSGPVQGGDFHDKTEEVEDFDVANEKYRIRNAHLNTNESHTLLLRDVTKYYGTFRAVNDICLGVSKGECFGLLGVNGAGKTSTFKMLTGDEKISTGDAFVENLSLRTNMKEVHQLIGYCPQFDALIDDLTGRETLTMFCLLRGIPRHEIPFIVDQLANDLLFMQHIDKKVKEYSGGNKRKLSTAVALVGDPPVVYLDEPTTGMDPVAKRHLWNVICKVRDSGKVIVLTSHSMEECEALCTRSAIMVNGQFKCLGSTQHLKNKFAEGYTLTVKVKRPPGEHMDFGAIDLEPIKKYVELAFPGSILREEYQGLFTYYIKNPTLTWARMFGMMEKAKQELSIEDYSLGQTSLEQVFLTFTKSQREEIG